MTGSIMSIMAIMSFAAVGHGFEFCKQFRSCVDCTENKFRCGWHKDGGCALRTSLHSDDLIFDDTCPVDYSTKSSFLPDWMGTIMPIIGDSTLLDISLPGTHDTLTYDLSTTVSEGGMDDALKIAALLHEATAVVPDLIEDYIRSGAQCQDLDVTQQLDAGVRFLDIRMMMEYTDDPSEWYSLHMMQSVHTSLSYFQEIRTWMDAHPSEVVVMWVSKHGNACATGEDQYPKVSIEQKQAMWKNILEIFDGVTVDFSVSKLNETSVNTMVERNHRAVFYVADYLEMTGYGDITPGTPFYGVDSCLLDNQLGNPMGPSQVEHQREIYAGANDRKAENKANGKFYLVSFAGDMDYVNAALLKFTPFGLVKKVNDTEITNRCVETFNVPGMEWCPETLLDGSQLNNYYTQPAMDELISNMMAGDMAGGLPNAIYINAVGGMDGTIRTGTEVLWGKNRSPDIDHATQGFAYVDSFILYNVLRICNAHTPSTTEECKKFIDLLAKRRERHPMTLWDDAPYGRLATW